MGPGFQVLKRKTKRPPFLEAAYAGVIVSNEIMVEAAGIEPAVNLVFMHLLA